MTKKKLMRMRYMKKTNRGIFKIFRYIGLFFDKWLISPITRIILKLMEIGRGSAKTFDRLAGKKSTLLVVSLILSFAVFIVIDRDANVMIVNLYLLFIMKNYMLLKVYQKLLILH